MLKGLRSVTGVVLVMMIAAAAAAQRPRTMNQDKSDTTTNVPPPPPAPQTVKAKYEGGVFGYNKKIEGTINFDEANQRLVFKDGKQKEILFVPYNAITGAYADTHSVQPAAATVAGSMPSIYALPARLIKTKVRYLTVRYDDPDSKVAGVTSFRLENKDILDSVLNSLAGKAGLNKRGDVFVKKRE
jgi:lipoprotein-anchoring transpeptidase ErfK/SrfK